MIFNNPVSQNLVVFNDFIQFSEVYSEPTLEYPRWKLLKMGSEHPIWVFIIEC